MKRLVLLLILAVLYKNSYQEKKYVEGLIGDIFFRTESRSLAVPIKGTHGKCQKEVPAIYFQTEYNERVRGNGSNIHYMYVETCCDGYKPYQYDNNRCVPECRYSCNNGICVAPNKCECMDGFVANASNHCIETCPVGCPNGLCFLNGTILCNKGYELDPTQKYCTAICRIDCGMNQVCISPDKCACLDGYMMTESGCQPVCSPDCGYGTCIAPNVCQCLGNAVKKHGTCHNYSQWRCENGISEGQYKCNCRVGYKYDVNTTTCLPDCGHDCKYGVCVAPGECRCFRRYEKKGNTCVPICPRSCGFYGKCIEPNVCGCGPDKQKCINGVCNSRGKCICEKNYNRYIDSCVTADNLTQIVINPHEQKRYNIELLNEFNSHIGKYFNFGN